jgi:hypothetical protein
MILNELFKNKEADFEYTTSKTDGQRAAETRLPDGSLIEVYMTRMGKSQNWAVAFFRDDSTEVTGAGLEIEVFKRVVFLLEKAMEEIQPKSVFMTSSQDNRTALYRRMLKRALPGWKIVTLRLPESNETLIAVVDGEFETSRRGVRIGISHFGYEADGTPDKMLSRIHKDDLHQIEPELEKVRNILAGEPA